MSSKAPPSAGVKKKIVKIVRKTVPKAKATLPEPTPPATATDAAPPTAASEPSATMGAAPDADADNEAITTATLQPEISATDATPNAAGLTSTETPAAQPAAPRTTPEPSETTATDATPNASDLVSTEAPAMQPAAPETTTEPAEIAATDTTPNASDLASTETPAPQLAARETTEEPSETATKKPAGKTTIRVRKVVKRVVVKRIPKVPAAAEVGKKAAVTSRAAAKVNPTSGPQNPSSSAAAGEASTQEEELVEQDKGCNTAEISEGQRRRKTEIFIGGLNRDAKEEDIRKVFGRVGEIVEVRLMTDGKTGKNKGYAFLRYGDAAQAKRAVSELAKVEVCGKFCGAAALEAKDTIFLGNIDKKWKKEHIIKLLQDHGIEKIDTVTVMADPNNEELNRGFAFLELETNKDAQIAYKKLQKKDVLGKGQNVKVAWAEPMNEPDEEEMQKVKSVYVEGIPSSWNEDKVRESFKRFGEIERVVLARNIKSAKRRDFAFVNYATREAALSCIASFEIEGLADSGTEVNVKVSLAKPVQKQNKGGSKSSIKDTFKGNTKIEVSSTKGKPLKGAYTTNGGVKESSTTHELLHVLREQAAWKQEQIGYARGSTTQDYTHALHGGKRSFSDLGHDTSHSDVRGYPHPRLDPSFPVTSLSYGTMPLGVPVTAVLHHQRQGVGYTTDAPYGASDHSSTLQGRQGAYPYGSLYSRY